MTNADISEFLQLVGLSSTERSSNVVISCPFAAVSGHKHAVDRHPSLGFAILKVRNDEETVWNCFTCGRKGDLREFFFQLQSALGVNCDAVHLRLDALEKGDPESIVATIPSYEQHSLRDPRRVYPTFPEEWLAPYAGVVPGYIVRRGLELPVLKQFEVGYDRMRSRVIFPVRDAQRQLVGAVGGLTRGALTREIEFQPKYKNYWHRIHTRCKQELLHRDAIYSCPTCSLDKVPPEEVAEGFRKSNFLYALWNKQPHHTTPIVVEGIVDCLRIWQALASPDCPEDIRHLFPVALFGSAPSRLQIGLLVSASSSRSTYLWMDDDVAGKKGDHLVRDAIRRRARLFRVPYPPYEEIEKLNPGAAADPGVLSNVQIYECLQAAHIIL